MAATFEAEGAFFFNGPGQRVLVGREGYSYAVRFRRGVHSESVEISPPVRRFLRAESEHVGFLPRYQLQLFRAREGSPADVRRRVVEVDAETPVAFATPVFSRSPSPLDVVLLNNGFLVEFLRDVNESRARDELERLNTRHGVTIVERLAYARPAIGYHLRAPAGDGERGPIELAKRYYESGRFVYAVPELIQRRVFRAGAAPVVGQRSARAPGDWLYEPEQWHLERVGVPAAWERAGTRGAQEIRIAIADDGVDVGHPEFVGKVAAEYDFDADVPDGNPKSSVDRHGTACAGVAAAKGVLASGVAPGCRLIAARFPENLGVAEEAKMFEWMADNGADVISCSWGPPDGTGVRYPLPGNVASAIRYCVTRGRGGRGIPIFWASGNGDEQISGDGYAANPDVIAVGACTDADTKAYYSDYGPEVAICAPSSGTRTAGHRYIFTTDRRGVEGYNSGSLTLGDAPGDYANNFGGTSSAAPLVAGVAALMLSVDPTLRWDVVREILEQTAVKIGSGYDAKGHSDIFGHGRVDADAAIAAVQRGFVSRVTESVTGPAQASRLGPAPELVVTVAVGRCYGLQLATDPRLFDASQAAGRTAETFYASWVDEGLSTAPAYRVPAAVWARMSGAGALYYRLLTSSSASSWVDAAAVPRLSQLDRVPGIKLSPSIAASASVPRNAAPPRFDIELDAGQFYAVELATAKELFTPPRKQARAASNFFGSWQLSPTLLSASSYHPPAWAWEQLASSANVYYRLLVSSSVSGWLSPAAVPSLARIESTPAIEILG